MRKKLIRNEMFYAHYPYAGDVVTSVSSGGVVSSPKIKRINPPVSTDSKEFHKRFKHQPSLISDIISGASISSLEDVEDGVTGAAGSGSVSSDTNLSPRTQCKGLYCSYF